VVGNEFYFPKLEFYPRFLVLDDFGLFRRESRLNLQGDTRTSAEGIFFFGEMKFPQDFIKKPTPSLFLSFFDYGWSEKLKPYAYENHFIKGKYHDGKTITNGLDGCFMLSYQIERRNWGTFSSSLLISQINRIHDYIVSKLD